MDTMIWEVSKRRPKIIYKGKLPRMGRRFVTFMELTWDTWTSMDRDILISDTTTKATIL